MMHSVIVIFEVMFLFFLFIGILAIIKMKTVGGGLTGFVVSIVGSVGPLAGIVMLTIHSYPG